MRSCEEFELLASLAADEEATLEELAELTEHLETCSDCRAYYEDIRRIHGAFSHEKIEVPEGLSGRVMDLVRAAEQDRPAEMKKVISFPRWRRWAALAACCAVVAMSVWAVGNFGGVKDAVVTADSVPRAAQDAPQEPGAQSAEDSIAEDGLSVLSGAAVPEYKQEAKSAAGDGEEEYQSPAGSNLEPAASPVEEYAPSLPEEGASFDDAGAVRADAPEEEDEEKDEGSDVPLPASAAPEEPAADVEPVEVIGVPEPGILIAFGGAAQDWVENTLGLEWSEGGSYPLTAQQYGGLMLALDAAGEAYRIEPGEGYCLMTE